MSYHNIACHHLAPLKKYSKKKNGTVYVARTEKKCRRCLEKTTGCVQPASTLRGRKYIFVITKNQASFFEEHLQDILQTFVQRQASYEPFENVVGVDYNKVLGSQAIDEMHC